MIAKVLTDDDPPLELVLGDDCVWTCEECPELAGGLNILHAGTFGPASGTPGYRQAHDAARLTKGAIAYLTPVPAISDPSMVY